VPRIPAFNGNASRFNTLAGSFGSSPSRNNSSNAIAGSSNNSGNGNGSRTWLTAVALEAAQLQVGALKAEQRSTWQDGSSGRLQHHTLWLRQPSVHLCASLCVNWLSLADACFAAGLHATG
jgi:hypothetical protein